MLVPWNPLEWGSTVFWDIFVSSLEMDTQFRFCPSCFLDVSLQPLKMVFPWVYLSIHRSISPYVCFACAKKCISWYLYAAGMSCINLSYLYIHLSLDPPNIPYIICLVQNLLQGHSQSGHIFTRLESSNRQPEIKLKIALFLMLET